MSLPLLLIPRTQLDITPRRAKAVEVEAQLLLLLRGLRSSPLPRNDFSLESFCTNASTIALVFEAVKQIQTGVEHWSPAAGGLPHDGNHEAVGEVTSVDAAA